MVQGNLISRVFGFLREVVVAFYFGASRATDIFAIAFTIPTLFRRILGEDMVEKAFLPSFRQLIAAGDYRRAWTLALRIFTLMLLLLLLLMGLCYLLTPRLVRLIGPGLSGGELLQTERMTYYVLPFMVVIGLASFVGGLLLFLDATASYALAPVFLSLGVIVGIATLKPYLGIYSMAVGFVLGGLLQFVFQIPAFIRACRRGGIGRRYSKPAAGEKLPEMREVGRQSSWIFLQSVASKSVEVVDRLLASYLVPGSVAALYFAQRLVQLPNAIIGLSVGRAGVTELNDQAQQGEWQAFRSTVIKGVRYNILCMLPLSVFLVVLADPITAVIFERGAFGRTSVKLTSLAFVFYALGLLGMSLWSLYTRVYPALAKNQVPLYSSLACAVVNIGLSLVLVRTPLKHGGLALASAIAFTLNAGLLFVALNAELHRRGQRSIGWQDLGESFNSATLASASGGLGAWAVCSGLRESPLLEGLPHILFRWQDLFALGAGVVAGAFIFLLTLGYWRRFGSRGGIATDRVILTGGGTGGHVNPALAIAEKIKELNPNARFLYVGVQGKAESVIVTRAGYPIRYVKARGFPGFRPSAEFVRFLLTLATGVVQSFYLISTFQPGMIIGTGGYVSAPVIFANTLMRALGLSRAQVLIHEQNSVPGKLNRFIGRRADQVLLTFPQTRSFFAENSVVVGYPVRRSVTLEGKGDGGKTLPVSIPPWRKVIFVFGGSQGARTINRALVDALGPLQSRGQELFVIHGVGLMNGPDYHAWEDTQERLRRTYSLQEREEMSNFYYAQDYFHNIGDIYSRCDLVVCRGGAGSLNEISVMGKPAIIIPKANLPGDHQVMNARAMKQAGAAEVIYEDTVMEEGRLLEKVEGEELAARILALLDRPQCLEAMGRCSRAFMRKNALEYIAAEIQGIEVQEDAGEESGADLQPLLSNSRLLDLLQSARQREGTEYDPRHVIADADDLNYYRHRAASLLTSPQWPERNVGVKLIGLLKHEEKLASLLHLLEERKPASRLQRWLGGDYQQVGFIRRNILTALQIIGRWSPEVEAAVFRALDDGYYEVRAQAARTMGYFASRLDQRRAVSDRLLELTADSSFEVVVEAALALGVVGDSVRVAEVLLGLKEHHYWQVRDAALRAVASLVKRGVVSDPSWVLSEISHFILTMTDFRCHFVIKDSYKELFQLCRDREEAGKPRT